ncbi:hypothetical protein FEP82_02099 [Burkholderia multivorans]|nr:hypothetical protein [Burkholderia multivorans]MDR8823598.1 hypothetical protein [Burkholderia multivorans]
MWRGDADLGVRACLVCITRANVRRIKGLATRCAGYPQACQQNLWTSPHVGSGKRTDTVRPRPSRVVASPSAARCCPGSASRSTGRARCPTTSRSACLRRDRSASIRARVRPSPKISSAGVVPSLRAHTWTRAPAPASIAGQRVVATAQRCEHREAVAVRQPEVEQQPVGGRAQRERSGVAVHSAVDREAFLFQTLFEPAADRRIVLDKQDARVRCRS